MPASVPGNCQPSTDNDCAPQERRTVQSLSERQDTESDTEEKSRVTKGRDHGNISGAHSFHWTGVGNPAYTREQMLECLQKHGSSAMVQDLTKKWTVKPAKRPAKPKSA